MKLCEICEQYFSELKPIIRNSIACFKFKVTKHTKNSQARYFDIDENNILSIFIGRALLPTFFHHSDKTFDDSPATGSFILFLDIRIEFRELCESNDSELSVKANAADIKRNAWNYS